MSKIFNLGIKQILRRPRTVFLIWVNNLNVADTKTLKSSYELKAIALCRSFMRNKSTRLSICPTTGKRFGIAEKEMFSFIIKNDDHGFCIDLFGTDLINIPICYNNYKRLIKTFDFYASAQREQLESFMRNSVADTFQLLYQKHLQP